MRFIHRIRRLAMVWLIVAPALAWGAEEHAEASPSIFTGNLGNAFWTLLIFAAVIFVLGRFAWKPILNGLQKREDFIRDSLEQARKDREESERALKEHTAKLHQARGEASAIVEEGRRDAEVLKHSIQEEARKESDAMIARARKEIGLARDTAISELYTMTVDLAADAAGRIIRRQLSPADHAELVRESIDEMRLVRGDGSGRDRN